MAMLAEGRKKQKFSFDPRNLTWSNDDSKFGHKLMEKMGWSKGKGLGVNEDGNVNHVAVSVKNNTRGVGCSKSYQDNWIAHQDDFNALLANLGQDHNTDEASESSSKVTSLEQTSKTSKGRLHYQKFTKGKDLSLKSESDLDCVFGKRKSQSGTNTPQMQSEPNSDNESGGSSEAVHGIPMVTSTDSVQDYFKKKMAEKLGKLKGASKPTEGSQETYVTNEENLNSAEMDIDTFAHNDSVNVEIESEPKSKSKKKSKKKKLQTEDSIDNKVMGEACIDEENVLKKSKKKKKKCAFELEGAVNANKSNEGDTSNNNDDDEETVIKKKSKKKKKSSEANQDIDETSVNNKNGCGEILVDSKIPEGDIKSKTKKSKKRKREKEVDSEENVEKKKKTVRFSIGVADDDIEDKLDRQPVDEKDCLKTEASDVSEVDSGLTNSSSVELDSKLEIAADKKFTTDNKNKKSYILPELKRHAEAFKGSNINCVSGYVGMPITAYDVKRKFANQKRK